MGHFPPLYFSAHETLCVSSKWNFFSQSSVEVLLPNPTNLQSQIFWVPPIAGSPGWEARPGAQPFTPIRITSPGTIVFQLVWVAPPMGMGFEFLSWLCLSTIMLWFPFFLLCRVSFLVGSRGFFVPNSLFNLSLIYWVFSVFIREVAHHLLYHLDSQHLYINFVGLF